MLRQADGRIGKASCTIEFPAEWWKKVPTSSTWNYFQFQWQHQRAKAAADRQAGWTFEPSVTEGLVYLWAAAVGSGRA